MTRTAGAPMGCQRPSRFWGLGCPKIYHEAEDTLANSTSPSTTPIMMLPCSTGKCRSMSPTSGSSSDVTSPM
ncbi:hypothetical protein [Thiolapillus sp.]|uniref:hypothetical protein n=1 Tax=Thiolapillus sp. TaxID=2017437 RepID=UPI0025D74F67|nr:hypothetical protein [Thiolapillus sp.]